MTVKEEQLEIELEAPEPNLKEEDIIIENEDDVPKQAKRVEIDPDDAINELQRKLNEAERSRQEAEQRARLAAAQAEKAKSEAMDSNYYLVESAIENLRREKDFVKQQLAEAHANGDFDRVAELQDALTKHNSDIADLDRGKNAMKQRQAAAEPPPPPPAPPIQGEMIDQIAASVTPRSAAWINANRDSLNDDKTIRKMFRAHEDAVEDGIKPDSDEYFRYIEGRLGFSEQTEKPMSSSTRRSSPPAAPVSRGSNGMGSRPNVVRLTAEQREMAQMMGMSDKEYAQNLLALQKEGKIGSKH